MEGVLRLKGSRLGGQWTERYFVLTGRTIQYFGIDKDGAKTGSQLGERIVGGVDTIDDRGSGKLPNRFDVVATSGAIKISAKDAGTKQCWIKAIEAAVAVGEEQATRVPVATTGNEDEDETKEGGRAVTAATAPVSTGEEQRQDGPGPRISAAWSIGATAGPRSRVNTVELRAEIAGVERQLVLALDDDAVDRLSADLRDKTRTLQRAAAKRSAPPLTGLCVVVLVAHTLSRTSTQKSWVWVVVVLCLAPLALVFFARVVVSSKAGRQLEGLTAKSRFKWRWLVAGDIPFLAPSVDRNIAAALLISVNASCLAAVAWDRMDTASGKQWRGILMCVTLGVDFIILFAATGVQWLAMTAEEEYDGGGDSNDEHHCDDESGRVLVAPAGVLAIFQIQVDSERARGARRNALKAKDFVWPLTNLFMVVSLFIFWAQMTAISFVPHVPWGVTSWMGEFWGSVGKLLLLSFIDPDWLDVPAWLQSALTAAITASLILGSVAMVFFLRSIAAMSSRLRTVLSKQRQALKLLERQTEVTERKKEELYAIENELSEAERKRDMEGYYEMVARLENRKVSMELKGKAQLTGKLERAKRAYSEQLGAALTQARQRSESLAGAAGAAAEAAARAPAGSEHTITAEQAAAAAERQVALVAEAEHMLGTAQCGPAAVTVGGGGLGGQISEERQFTVRRALDEQVRPVWTARAPRNSLEDGWHQVTALEHRLEQFAELEHIKDSFKGLEQRYKCTVDELEERETAKGAADATVAALNQQQGGAKESVRASERAEEPLVRDVLETKAVIKAKHSEINDASRARSQKIVMKAFSATMAVFFAGVMKRLLASLACSGYFASSEIEHEYLTADATQLAPHYTSCFVGGHRTDAVIGFVGLLGLYPASIIVRPLFQALDLKLNMRFSYNFLFVSGQLQMLLLVVSAFAPQNPDLLLLMALTTNAVCAYYFRRLKPCTSAVINKLAFRAFGFSASLNVGSLVVLHTNNDIGPSLALFVYVGWLVWGLIWVVQA
jgi:hypothetical protein